MQLPNIRGKLLRERNKLPILLSKNKRKAAKGKDKQTPMMNQIQWIMVMNLMIRKNKTTKRKRKKKKSLHKNQSLPKRYRI
jgi:hypothetical protein